MARPGPKIMFFWSKNFLGARQGKENGRKKLLGAGEDERMKRKKVSLVGRWLRGATWAPTPMARPDRLAFWLTELEVQFEALPRSIYPPGQPPPHLWRSLPTDNIWHVSPH